MVFSNIYILFYPQLRGAHRLKFPAFARRGQIFEASSEKIRGGFLGWGNVNHPCVIRLTLHDAVPSLSMRGI